MTSHTGTTGGHKALRVGVKGQTANTKHHSSNCLLGNQSHDMRTHNNSTYPNIIPIYVCTHPHEASKHVEYRS